MDSTIHVVSFLQLTTDVTPWKLAKAVDNLLGILDRSVKEDLRRNKTNYLYTFEVTKVEL